MPYRQTERSEKVRATSRDKILRAARKLFAQRGVDATTMQDIVKAAGTSIGNLYFYFANKEELLATLSETALRAAWARGDAAMGPVPPGPARLAVMAYANAYGLLVADRDLFKILLAADALRVVRDRLVNLNIDRVRAILQENIPSLPAEDLDLAVVVWTGAGRYLVEQGMDDGRLKKAGPARLAEFLVRWNLRALKVPEREIDKAIAVAERFLAERSPG